MEDTNQSRQYGIVKMYNRDRGFGFIRPELPEGQEAKDIFFHFTKLSKGIKPETIKNGMKVGFFVKKTLFKGKQGVCAVDVDLLDNYRIPKN